MNTGIQQITCKGLVFSIRPGTTDEKVIPEVVQHHCYERSDFRIMAGEKWADIGANIGSFSCVAAQRGASVFAFEPEPDNYKLLNENVAFNGFGDQIKLYKFAITASGKELSLYTCKSNRNKYRHSILPHKGWNTIETDCQPFDFILSLGVNCIKMDCEGSELQIFDQKPDLSNIKKLVFEYHFDLDRSIANFIKRIKYLSSFYSYIHYAKLPPGETYDFFPAARIVYCRQ